MSKSRDRPVHISDPHRNRPPGKAGETIVTKFENMIQELSRTISGDDSTSERLVVSVTEADQAFRVVVSLGFKGATAKIDDDLILLQDLPVQEGPTSLSFALPGDLERDLIDVRLDGDVLTIRLPRTAETTRAVRQLEASRPEDN